MKRIALAGARAAASRLDGEGGGCANLRADIDWRCCTEIAREHGRTFYHASLFLPKARRQAVHATYAFCRIADDIADRSPNPEIASRDLDEWERQIDEPTDPVAVAFAAARNRYGVPTAAVRELLAGVRMDLVPRRYSDWDDARVYCYRVAGTVGLMVAPILGCLDTAALPHAVNLGIAMQWTNILRDIGEDARRGRLYLPLEDLTAFGCDPEALMREQATGRFVDLLDYEIARARRLYADAHHGFPALSPSGRLTALAGCELYGAILTRIEENGYDVFARRAHISTRRKLAAMPGIAATFMRLSWQPRPSGFSG
ncbi:MAG TPA: phytoene/squalene synthase family protein [Thermomicrobiales bacterium]|jgi:phytoene synthase|nr:phytoene/squalene synthase family protein [Thermomicrobiales bacterium]